MRDSIVVAGALSLLALLALYDILFVGFGA